MKATNSRFCFAASAAILLIFGAPAAAQSNNTRAQPTNSRSTNSATGASLSKSATHTGGAPAPSHAAPVARTPTPPAQPAAAFVNCHALETHTSASPAVMIIVFNQRDKQDHVRLSDLLKQNDGAGVELRTSDGKWHKATLVRLRSCFGCGMLFLGVDAAQIKDRDNFLLRFPLKKTS